ncbi:MAG: glycosyltransferase [Chloroflexota bacterium]
MSVQRVAILSVHTSPLAPLGGKKTGGMNVYIREMANELARRGVEVDIFTRRTSRQQLEIDTSLGSGVRVINVNAGLPIVLDPDDVYQHVSQFAAGVIAFATKKNIVYPLIYSHYWLSGWIAHKLKEVWNTPFVHMFHTLGHMKQRIGVGPVRLPDVRIATETQIVAWADRIIAATPAEYAQLLWLYRADRRKITIIPPGVNESHFFPIAQSEAKARIGVDDDCELLLFVGRIEPLKAVDTILEAISLIRHEQAELARRICFGVIGGDPKGKPDTEMMRLQDLTRALDLGDVVQFLGAKDHRLLPIYYAAATAVILPSDYESFGMVALEAMASGTPVIASEVGGLAFLVQDEQTGFLVPVRDPVSLSESIVNLLTQPHKRKLLSENAVALAQQYTWTHIVDKLVSVFEAVLDQQSSNRRKR